MYQLEELMRTPGEMRFSKIRVLRDQYRIHSLILLRHNTLRNWCFEWKRKVSCLFSLSLTFLMNCQRVSLFPVFRHKFFHARCICFYFWQDRENMKCTEKERQIFCKKNIIWKWATPIATFFSSYRDPEVLPLFDFFSIV